MRQHHEAVTANLAGWCITIAPIAVTVAQITMCAAKAKARRKKGGV